MMPLMALSHLHEFLTHIKAKKPFGGYRPNKQENMNSQIQVDKKSHSHF